jgi:hypothetical protein
MKLTKKILLSLTGLGILIFLIVLPLRSTESKVKSYYSGDVILYNGHTVVATTNTGKLELFTLSNSGNLERFAELKTFDRRFGTLIDFRDVLLNIEEGSLYAYTVDGKVFTKYNISNLSYAQEVTSTENTTWDWFGGVEKINGYVATVGTKGIRLWTANLKVYDEYKITTPGNYTFNSTEAGSNNNIFTISDGEIKVFDRQLRQVVRTVPLQFKWSGDFYKREIYNDPVDNMLYVVDDEALRKISANGEVVKSFYHTGKLGYDVVPSSDGKYIYFSDGIGVVKMQKSDLKVVDFVYTQSLGEGNGWATGLRVLNKPVGDIIVLFNASAIMIFDESLEPMRNVDQKLTTITTNEIETFPVISGPVYLKIDKNRAAPGSMILLSGGGFGADEDLVITFLDTERVIQANKDGAFSVKLTVPSSQPKGVDIKVKGQASNIKYSLGFTIE